MTEIDDNNYKLPSREQHNEFIRKIWRWCVSGAISIFIITGGVVGALFWAGYDSKKVVEVSTSVFQVLVLSYGLGFFVPAFLTSLIKMSLGVEMSRRSLDIGAKTAGHIDRLQGELTPVIGDLKDAVKDAKEIVHQVKDEELKKALTALQEAKEAMVEIKNAIQERKKTIEGNLEKSLAEELIGTVKTGSNGSAGGYGAGSTDETARLCATCKDGLDSETHKAFCVGKRAGEELELEG